MTITHDMIEERKVRLADRKVAASSVKDYIKRYYKQDHLTNTLVQSYEYELEQFGMICTSRHDNITGHFIVWWPDTEEKTS